MLLRMSSLRTKIIAWSFIPTTIILVAVVLVSLYAYQRITEDLVTGRNRELTRLAASKRSTEMREYADLLSAVARTDVSDPDPATRRQALARAANQLVIFDGGVVVLNPRGVVVAAQPERPEALGHDWSNRSYFQHLYQSSGALYSDIVSDGPQGAEVVPVAVAIVGRQGELGCAVVGMFRLGASSVSAFYAGFVKQRIEEAGIAYVVDANGRVIYHSNPERIGQDDYGQAVVRYVLGGRVGDIRLRDLDGNETLASYAPIPGTPWGLVTEQSWEALMASSQVYRWLLFVLLALGVVVPAAAVTFGAARITRSIRDLIEASQYVAEGHFGRTISASANDEIEELAKQFNRMSAQLQQSYSQPEKRVADRTKELATLNGIATTVSRSLNLAEVLQEALTATMVVTKMETGAAYRLNADDRSLVLLASHGLSEEFAHRAGRFPLVALGAWLGDGGSQPGVLRLGEYPTGDLACGLEHEGVRLVVTVPLIVKGKLLGAISLGVREAHFLAPEEISLLSAIGQKVGIATENARLYEQAERSAATAERNCLARDLHDAVSQTLFSASLIAEVLPRLWECNPDEVRRRLGELRQLTRGALAEMRTLLLELRPSTLSEGALGDLLRQLCEATTGRARLPVALQVDGERTLPPEVQVAPYRIVQEALNNVAKHSGAEHASVEVQLSPQGLELSVSDDGRGFDRAAVPVNHMGLGIMSDRAEAIGAELRIVSEPGQGTEVTVIWRDAAASEQADINVREGSLS